MKIKSPIWYLFFLIIVLLAIGWLFFATEKTMREVNSLKVEIGRQESNNVKLGELAVILPTLTAETFAYEKTLPTNEEEVATFVSLVESLVKDAGLTVVFHFEDFPGKIDVSGKNIYGLGSEITLEGSFQGLTTFLTRLSGMPYFFKVDKLMLLKLDNRSGVKSLITGYLMMNPEKK
jgi:Tfp pilus assembly protein PilO